MSEGKMNTKLSILLFLAFAILTIFLLVSMVQMIGGFIKNIDKNTDDLKCASLNYKIEEGSITYSNSNLQFRLQSSSYDVNITKITLGVDGVQDEKFLMLDKPLTGGNKKYITFENVSIAKGFYIYPEECINKKLQGKI
jgi:hypothetical protein